ncbi:MAG: Fis family transcriptional regulator [Gemmatimonadetes bacterium]|nr:Fis family transcriptional regulator [Gemmatimonadota bacterium]
MPNEVFTEEWSRACCQALNGRPNYAAVAAGWRDAVVLVMGADPSLGIHADRAVFLDLYEGACRGTRLATEHDRATAPFVLRAEAAAWRRLLSGETDAVSAVLSGQLRLERGNLMAMAQHAPAAREMLAAAAEAGGVFPGMG